MATVIDKSQKEHKDNNTNNETTFDNETALKQRELKHTNEMLNAWHQNKNPFDTANFFDQLIFSFFTPLMKRGYKQDLVPIGMFFFIFFLLPLLLLLAIDISINKINQPTNQSPLQIHTYI